MAYQKLIHLCQMTMKQSYKLGKKLHWKNSKICLNVKKLKDMKKIWYKDTCHWNIFLKVAIENFESAFQKSV